MAALAMIVLATGAGQQPDTPLPLRPAPPFELERLDGSGAQLRLSDFRGTAVLVNFWASWCVPCLQEMPELQALAERFRGELVVIGVNMWDDRESARELLAELNITYPTGIDTDNIVVTAYEVNSVPSTAFITADGRFAAIARGKPSTSELADMVHQHLGLAT